ncbi:unnamed protein product, partial [Rotaria sp. Silwood1]
MESMVGKPVRRRATRLFYRRTTEPTGRITRSVHHNNTKQQGGRDDTSEQGARRDDTSEQGDRRDTTQQGGRGDTSLQPRKDVPQSSNCNNNRAAII